MGIGRYLSYFNDNSMFGFSCYIKLLFCLKIIFSNISLAITDYYYNFVWHTQCIHENNVLIHTL